MKGNPEDIYPPQYLFREKPLTREEWIELINQKIRLLKEYFDKIPLPTLGSMEVLRIYRQSEYNPNIKGYHLDRLDSGTRGDLTKFTAKGYPKDFGIGKGKLWRNYSSNTHGTFLCPNISPDSFVPKKNFFGLLRTGELVIGTIHVKQEVWFGQEFPSDVPTMIEIEETDVEGVMAHTGISAYRLFRFLSDAPVAWKRSLKGKLKVANKLCKSLRSTRDLVDDVCGVNPEEAAIAAFQKEDV